MSLSLDDRSLEDLVDDDLLREFGLFFPHKRLNEVRRLIQRLVAAVHTAQEDQELLKLCAIWLFHHGKTEDIPLLWKAKESSFDNHFIIDSYLLCGAGLQTTFDFVADSNIADKEGLLETLDWLREDYLLDDKEQDDLRKSHETYYAPVWQETDFKEPL